MAIPDFTQLAKVSFLSSSSLFFFFFFLYKCHLKQSEIEGYTFVRFGSLVSKLFQVHTTGALLCAAHRQVSLQCPLLFLSFRGVSKTGDCLPGLKKRQGSLLPLLLVIFTCAHFPFAALLLPPGAVLLGRELTATPAVCAGQCKCLLFLCSLASLVSASHIGVKAMVCEKLRALVSHW